VFVFAGQGRMRKPAEYAEAVVDSDVADILLLCKSMALLVKTVAGAKFACTSVDVEDDR
jgi:hypothetical protein